MKVPPLASRPIANSGRLMRQRLTPPARIAVSSLLRDIPPRVMKTPNSTAIGVTWVRICGSLPKK